MQGHWFLATALVGVITALIAEDADPIIIQNTSPSVPTGFYLRVDHAPAPGDFVTVRAVRVAPTYARLRHFTDPSDRFIKRVAAIEGDSVCARDGAVIVRGAIALPRETHDRESRSLPLWSGCRTLGPGELFLAGDTADSFDSRYWGPVVTDLVDGVWVPLRAPAGSGAR
jgi:type IV secretory pathway protease TraF